MKQKRILVIRPDRVGDVVLATPLVRELRKTFPDSFIAVMLRPQTKDVFLNNPHIDDIIVDDYEGEDKGFKGFLKQVFKLRKYKFNIALHLLPTQRHAWMTFLAGIRTRINVGIRLYGVLTFMKYVSRKKYNPLRHEADYSLDLGRKIGVKSENIEPEIFLTNEEIKQAEKLVPKEENEIVIGINPLSGKSSPNWKIEKYIELTKKILEEIPNAKIYVNLFNNTDARLEFEKLNSSKIKLIQNSKLRELILYVSRFDLLISSSTGAMHIASALKVPTVSMFCPLPACSPKLWGPLGNRHEIILPPENYCQAKCPGDPHICTFEGGIEVEDVLKAIRKILSETKIKVSSLNEDENSSGEISRH
ncbi:glycosyltransferase family 9 protein [Candidatus Chrysopegis kryptomonas]|uniref:Heptosyltransferase-2 n=1 Tax=Candidatus Chryseopegocella kryptomonas TaxID=1633643 RepID=A0A0N7MX51_9BACT|nr:glycosyltransferase family 9 protein [Candidatus Chrysopegis kryptomonas]CUT00467.1 heptosyltransferase-2 [Candidatus Chrysopegis kryptomonas]